jgi:flagellin-like protein
MIKPLNKKAVSPVIATVLLIGLVIVIALIIFLWFKGLTQEAITKFDKNVELVCDEVKFEAGYADDFLSVSNIGNIPIYEMKVKFVDEGSHTTKGLKTISSWPGKGLNQGKTFSDDIGSEVSTSNSLTLTPVLVGTSESGQRTYTCDERRYGLTITI